MLFQQSSNKSLSLHLTALRTRLSRGFLLGSLVEDRIPVPQLLASVFLQERQRKLLTSGAPGDSRCPGLFPLGSYGGITTLHDFEAKNWKTRCSVQASLRKSPEISAAYTEDEALVTHYLLSWLKHQKINVIPWESTESKRTYRSKKVARRRLRRTLCLTPAHRWQFISCPRVMYTPEPGRVGEGELRITPWPRRLRASPVPGARRRQRLPHVLLLEAQQGRQDFWTSPAGAVTADPWGLGKSQLIIIPNVVITERKSMEIK